MEKVKLLIAGETYSLTTEDNPEILEKTGADVDKKISDYLSLSGRFSITQCAVLTALEYAEKCGTLESNLDNLRGQLHDYIDEAARAKADAEILRRENEKITKELKEAKGR